MLKSVQEHQFVEELCSPRGSKAHRLTSILVLFGHQWEFRLEVLQVDLESLPHPWAGQGGCHLHSDGRRTHTDPLSAELGTGNES